MTRAQVETVKQALLCIEKEKIEQFYSKHMVEPTYSEKYNNTISSLIKNQRERESSALHLTYRQRIALLIATVLLTALTITACANAEAIKGFIVKIYEEYVDLTPSNKQYPTIFVEHNPTFIPEGYVLCESYTAENMFFAKRWRNESGEIFFRQDSNTVNIISAAEKNGYEIKYIDNNEILYYYKHNTHSLIWSDEKYIFTLNCADTITWEEIEMIVRSIQPIEETPADPE